MSSVCICHLFLITAKGNSTYYGKAADKKTIWFYLVISIVCWDDSIFRISIRDFLPYTDPVFICRVQNQILLSLSLLLQSTLDYYISQLLQFNLQNVS